MEKFVEVRKYSEHFLNIVNELISTENTFNEICRYVQEFLIQNKEAILKLIQENNIVFTEEELDGIINHFSIIGSQPIQKLLKSDEEIDAFLKNYVEPLKDENIETDLLKRWTSISRLMAFYTAHGDLIALIDKNFTTTRKDRLSIQSYFITPIQRLPRIALFFGEMQKNVEDKEASKNIEIMLEGIRGTLKTINEEILHPLEQAILKTETNNKWAELWISNKNALLNFVTSETIIWKASPEAERRHFQKSMVHKNHIATVFALIQIKRQLIKKESEKIENKEEKLNEEFLASCRGFLEEIKEDVIPENNVAVPSDEYDFDIGGDDKVDLTRGMNLGKAKPPKEIHIDEEDRIEAELIEIEDAAAAEQIKIEDAEDEIDTNLKKRKIHQDNFFDFAQQLTKFVKTFQEGCNYKSAKISISLLPARALESSEKSKLTKNLDKIILYIEEKEPFEKEIDKKFSNIEALSKYLDLFGKNIPFFIEIALFLVEHRLLVDRPTFEAIKRVSQKISSTLWQANATFEALNKLLEEQPETFGIYKETIKNNLEIIEKALKDYKAQVTQAVNPSNVSPAVVVLMNVEDINIPNMPLSDAANIFIPPENNGSSVRNELPKEKVITDPTTNINNKDEQDNLPSLEKCIEALNNKIQTVDSNNILYSYYVSLKYNIEKLNGFFEKEIDEQEKRKNQKNIDAIWDWIKYLTQTQTLEASMVDGILPSLDKIIIHHESFITEWLDIAPSTVANIKYVLFTIALTLLAITLISLLTAGIATGIAVSVAGTLSMSAFIATFTGVGVALTTIPTAATAPSLAMVASTAVVGAATLTSFGAIGTTKTLEKIGLFRNQNYYVEKVKENIQTIQIAMPRLENS